MPEIKNRLIVFIITMSCFLAAVAVVHAQGEVSESQVRQAVENMTPAQREAVKSEVLEGSITSPQKAIQVLKAHPEFQGISPEAVKGLKGVTPEEIEKGKRLLEQKTAGGRKAEEGKKEEQGPEIEKRKRGKDLFWRYISSTPANIDLSGKDLEPYGYAFFENRPQSLSASLPVPDDYIIGPGDTIEIFLWGRIYGRYELDVNREGLIDFPQIGPLPVAGMTLKEMRSFLKKQAEQIVGTSISTTMGRLRSIQVFALGEVEKPGPYLVSALATVTDALVMAGGPSGIGSLRDIQIRRKNKTVDRLDFYDLLQTGDRSRDITLQNSDVIFVPPVGDLVGIAGNVKRPAVYELKEKKDLASILTLAGGVIPSAYKQHIQVERFLGHEKRICVDINLEEVSDKPFLLRDGDLVKVFPVIAKEANVIYIYGNFNRPGKYQWKEGMKVNDIIKKKEQLITDTYMDYALIKRLDRKTLQTFLIPFRLGEAINGNPAENVPLAPQDQIYIFSRWFFIPKDQITISGEIRRPGTYQIEGNTKVKDVILLAEGLTRNAAFHAGEILRRTSEKTYKLIHFSPTRALKGMGNDNLLVRDGDKIIIHSIEEEKPVYNVTIKGEVRTPGEYILTKGETVADLIFRAGGLRDSAYLDEAELFRLKIVQGKSFDVKRMIFSPSRALKRDPEHNIKLKPYDELMVKRIPEWRNVGTVMVRGEVVFPGNYTIEKGESLVSLLNRAGGYTGDAFLKGARLTRESVRISQQAHLKKIINMLEMDVAREAAAIETKAQTALDVEAMKESIKYRKDLLNKLKKIEAPGQICISFRPLDEMADARDNITLEDGDAIMIPEYPGTVHVLGMVYNATTFLYRPGMDLDEYLELGGGILPMGDKKRVYLEKADGRTLEIERGFKIFSANRYIPGIGGVTVEEGDSIIVPESPQLPGAGWKKTRDFVQFVYNTAASMAVLKYLFE